MSAALQLEAAPVQSRAAARWRVREIAVLALVALLGMLELGRPFEWDQSVFVLGARTLARGGVLYRDFWDLKQPGIYLFYLTGGRLIGFSEFGIHLFELLGWLGFSVLLLHVGRTRFRSPWAVCAAPLLTVGMYYAHTRGWHLTQVEALAGMPLFVALWASCRACEVTQHRWRWALLAGIAGGVCLVFKLMFLPLVVALWLPALATRMRAGWGPAFSTAFALLFGLLVPIALVVARFEALHATRELVDATFNAPLRIAGLNQPLRLREFERGLTWFLPRWGPMLIIGGIGTLFRLRRSFDPFEAGLLIWIVAGAAVILAQRFSLWEYHYLLLVVPTGLLGARALEEALAGTRRSMDSKDRSLLVAGACVALFLWPFVEVSIKGAVATHHVVMSAFHGRTGPPIDSRDLDAHERIRAEVAFLGDPDAPAGPIFVVGNPLYHLLSRRPPAIPVLGGLLTSLATRADWETMTAALEQRPPVWVFLANDKAAWMRAHPDDTVSFFDWLGRAYVPDHAGFEGTWYRLRPAR